jgi:hypothetical protein
MSVQFVPVPLKDYEGGGCIARLEFPFSAVKTVLGEPWRNYPIRRNKKYPDDDDKTDVCWSVKSPEGHVLTVWNYKNGPAYGEKVAIEDIDFFSVYYTNEGFFKAVKEMVEQVAKGLANGVTVVCEEKSCP